MGFRNFFRVLFKGRATRPRHSGDDLADEVSETLSGSAGRFGRGNERGIYRYLEKRKRK